MLKEEFVIFAEKYMDMIYRIAYSWTKNSHDANDVTQDVLIQLYKTTKVFETDAYLKNWLIRVTVNRCKMMFRSPWKKVEDINDYAETLGFEDESHLELFHAVMKLDKKYRIPLMLFYYEGYSTAETAALLGISENTVSTRLFRAKAKLKDYLKEE
ncbi:RNA polymerase sigma factor [[Ruminococcus] torques]|uniref:RNA polymerase sigma factor n=1 Tax=[Ruminococcus] torques TaxID=33039 RepID=UPI0024329E8C|nr:sigma-70 family RNA polymerase sigma factor [[Ruminococcus] torques]